MTTGNFLVFLLLAVLALCMITGCFVLIVKKTKSKKKAFACLAVVIVCVLTAGLVGWNTTRTLVSPKDLDKVKEIDVKSASGASVKLTDQTEIQKLYKAFSGTKIKNTFDGNIGNAYHVVISSEDKVLYDFSIKSEAGGKKGVILGYKVVEGDNGYTYLQTLLKNKNE